MSVQIIDLAGAGASSAEVRGNASKTVQDNKSGGKSEFAQCLKEKRETTSPNDKSENDVKSGVENKTAENSETAKESESAASLEQPQNQDEIQTADDDSLVQNQIAAAVCIPISQIVQPLEIMMPVQMPETGEQEAAPAVNTAAVAVPDNSTLVENGPSEMQAEESAPVISASVEAPENQDIKSDQKAENTVESNPAFAEIVSWIKSSTVSSKDENSKNTGETAKSDETAQSSLNPADANREIPAQSVDESGSEQSDGFAENNLNKSNAKQNSKTDGRNSSIKLNAGAVSVNNDAELNLVGKDAGTIKSVISSGAKTDTLIETGVQSDGGSQNEVSSENVPVHSVRGEAGSITDSELRIQTQDLNFTQVDRANLPKRIAQIVADFHSEKSGSQKTVELSLTPSNLGNMQVTLRMENGKVYTDFVCSPEAAGILKENLPQLKTVLASNGVQLGESSISYGNNSSSDYSRQQSESGKKQQKRDADREMVWAANPLTRQGDGSRLSYLI